MTKLYASNPAMFRSHPISFLICLLPLFWPILIWWYLHAKATKVSVTSNEVLYEHGLLSKDRTELNLKHIRTVKVKQSITNRIMKVGKVEIYTAGDAPEIVAKGLPQPHKIRDIIKEAQNRGAVGQAA